jgi:hypothetical protein
MSLPTLEQINIIYECAARYTVQRHRVKYSEFGQFCLKLNMLKDQIGESASDPYWQKYFSDLRRFRFGLTAAPFLNEYRDRRILEIYDELSNHLKHCRAVYPDFAQPALEILSLLKRMYQDEMNPLLNKLIEISASHQSVAWVIKESRLIPHVDDVIQMYPDLLHRVQALHYTQMVSSNCFDRVITIGSPRWFPDSIYTSPRANEMHIVQFSWMRDAWKLPETFVAQYTPTRSKRISFTDHNPVEDLGITSESLLLTLESEALAAYTSRDGHRDYEEIEARCVVLEGEQAIFVEADDSANVLIIDLDEDDDNRVNPISVRDLKPGAFILVRTSGGGDYIVPIADQIMGTEASLVRQRQHEWKSRLKEYVIKHGLLKTSIDLLDLGSDIANEINVRNWIFPRNIKTRSQNDFLAIMRLVGLENQANEFWASMEFISRAHRKAGYRLREILLDQVDKISPDEFKRSGKVEFKFAQNDEDAGLTAFRIEEILSKTYKVSFSRIGVPFRLGN